MQCTYEILKHAEVAYVTSLLSHNMLKVAYITGYIFLFMSHSSFATGNYLPILNSNHLKVADMLLFFVSVVLKPNH